MSPELKQFHKDLQAWIDNGCTDSLSFRRHEGLCYNVWFWAYFRKLDGWELRRELKSSFKNAGLDEEIPFNVRVDDFNEEENCYTNKARLEWIHQHAMED